ncbi:hypothetical protein R69746_08221 [Paraburkholderia aspalathi]|nr:hypothetical protein R69746_08221 [Paraburkholderia aspalathi]
MTLSVAWKRGVRWPAGRRRPNAYGVHPVLVGQWKKEIQERAAALFEAKRGPKPADDQGAPERLYGEIGRLKMEVDWLKKKLSLPRRSVKFLRVWSLQTPPPDDRRLSH